MDSVLQELTYLFNELIKPRPKTVNIFAPLIPGDESNSEQNSKAFWKRRNEILQRIKTVVSQNRNEAVTDFLVELTKHPNDSVRHHAVGALGEMQAASKVDYLITILNNYEDYDFSSCAATALGKIGDRAAVPALIETLRRHNIDPEIIWTSAHALGFIGDSAAIDPLFDTLLDDYADFRHDDRDDIHDAAKDALVAIGSEEVAERLLGLFVGPDLKQNKLKNDSLKGDILLVLGRLAYPKVLPLLLEMTKSDNDEFRFPAVMGLGFFPGNDEVIQCLLPLRDDEWVDWAAHASLKQLGYEDEPPQTSKT